MSPYGRPIMDNPLKAPHMAFSWIEREVNRYGQEYSVNTHTFDTKQ